MKIFISGHKGLLGSHIIQRLTDLGYRDQLILRSRKELDLTDQKAVNNFYQQEKPTSTVMCAGRVGGILDNQMHNGDMIRENLLMAVNTIEAARQNNCERFCYLGSSCIYPRLAPQPIKEEYLLTSPLELTNFGYATSKIAGVQLIKAYRQQYGLKNYYSLMPTNLYGPGDRFDEVHSHVIPALIKKFHTAKIEERKTVHLFGTGKAYREFLFAEDASRMITQTLFIDNMPELVNLGTGEDLTINELALLIKKIVGFNGKIEYDHNNPDGTPRKLLDISKMKSLGLNPTVKLEDGLKRTYEWYIQNHGN